MANKSLIKKQQVAKKISKGLATYYRKSAGKPKPKKK